MLKSVTLKRRKIFELFLFSEDESTEHKDLEELKESPISNIKENSENQHVLSLALIKQTNEQNR